MPDLQQYPALFDKVWIRSMFSLFKRFIFFCGLCKSFFFIKNNGEILKLKQCLSQKNDAICPIFYQIKLSKVPNCTSSIDISFHGGSLEITLIVFYRKSMRWIRMHKTDTDPNPDPDQNKIDL